MFKQLLIIYLLLAPFIIQAQRNPPKFSSFSPPSDPLSQELLEKFAKEAQKPRIANRVCRVIKIGGRIAGKTFKWGVVCYLVYSGGQQVIEDPRQAFFYFGPGQAFDITAAILEEIEILYQEAQKIKYSLNEIATMVRNDKENFRVQEGNYITGKLEEKYKIRFPLSYWEEFYPQEVLDLKREFLKLQIEKKRSLINQMKFLEDNLKLVELIDKGVYLKLKNIFEIYKKNLLTVYKTDNGKRIALITEIHETPNLLENYTEKMNRLREMLDYIVWGEEAE